MSERLPKPNQIVVHDFGDEPAEIAADSALASQASAPVTPPSVEQLALGRRLGSSIADDQFVEQDSLDAAEVRIVEGYYDLDSGKVEWKTE